MNVEPFSGSDLQGWGSEGTGGGDGLHLNPADKAVSVYGEDVRQ